jgi:tetratricopeptide (TPR) repeat protein
MLPVVALLAAAGPALADGVSSIDWIQLDLARCQHTVKEIRNWAYASLAIAILIGCLGVLVSAAQASTANAAKRFVVASGIVISVLTIVNGQLFRDTTHQKLFKYCGEGEALLKKLERHINKHAGITQADPRYASFLQVAEEQLTKCDDLDKRFAGESVEPRQEAFLSFGSTAWAGVHESLRSGPDWIVGRQATDRVVYFVGVGHGRDLSTSRADSLDNGREQVREYVLNQFSSSDGADKADRDRLASRLANGAGLVDTYTAFDGASGLLSYYSLLTLDRREARRAVLIHLEGQANVEVARRLETAPGPSNAYEKRRQVAYACILDTARQRLREPQYELLVQARELRKEADQSNRDYGKTIERLDALVKDAPDCYLCWFNLAIAYERSRQNPEAESSFARAAALEPALGCKDASIYSTFGRFLLRSGQSEKAVPMLRQALAYEPEHLYAKRLLEEAERAGSTDRS